MWPTIILDYDQPYCRMKLRKYQLKAYSAVIRAFRAQGDLNIERKKILRELASVMSIPLERHRSEVTRAVNDEKLITISYRVTGELRDEQWIIETKRLIPLLCRTDYITELLDIADACSDAAQTRNSRSRMMMAARDHRKRRRSTIDITTENKRQKVVAIEDDHDLNHRFSSSHSNEDYHHRRRSPESPRSILSPNSIRSAEIDSRVQSNVLFEHHDQPNRTIITSNNSSRLSNTGAKSNLSTNDIPNTYCYRRSERSRSGSPDKPIDFTSISTNDDDDENAAADKTGAVAVAVAAADNDICPENENIVDKQAIDSSLPASTLTRSFASDLQPSIETTKTTPAAADNSTFLEQKISSLTNNCDKFTTMLRPAPAPVITNCVDPNLAGISNFNSNGLLAESTQDPAPHHHHHHHLSHNHPINNLHLHREQDSIIPNVQLVLASAKIDFQPRRSASR